MDAQGRVWAERVFRGQLNAVARPKKQANPQGADKSTDLIDEYECPRRVHATETLNMDDSGKEMDDDEQERPQPTPQSSPQPSPLADTPPSPDEETALNMDFIRELLLGDIDALEENEALPSVEDEPPSSTVTNREPPPEASTSRGEPGLNLLHLRLRPERKDQDSDSD